MILKHRMFLVAMLSAAFLIPAFAADAPVPPVVPAGETPAPKAPKADAKKKASSNKKAVEQPKEEPAKPAQPELAVTKQNHVVVRGQAKIDSEVVTRLGRGQLVTVLEEITHKKVKADEPAKWYKIALPTNAFPWVNATFLDAHKNVVPKKLNLRSGPGENYSIIGLLEKGAAVTVVDTKGDWSKIEPPAGTFAFVAAHLVSKDPAAIAAVMPKVAPAVTVAATTPPPVPTRSVPPPVVTPPVVAPTPTVTSVTTVSTPPPIATPGEINTPPPVVASAPVLVPAVRPTTVVTPPPPPPSSITPTPELPAEPAEEVFVKRIVTREGIVKGSVSIQAPSYFVLRSLDNNRTVNYLHSSSTNLVVKGFKGQRVLIVGEELLDERWPNTPVIEIESIEAVEK